MYLRKKTWIGAKYEHNKTKGKIEVETMGKPVFVKLERVSEIVEDIAYWRKANAIHKWFVDNIQNGEDDCKPYEFEIEKLEELKATIERIFAGENAEARERLANELLPTCEGFFFGSTKIDKDYWEDLKNTLKIIEEIREDAKQSGGGWISYEYQASW